MRSSHLKLAVLSALRPDPDFAGLRRLNTCSRREIRAFLRLLDQSGLALYLAWRLRERDAFETIPAPLRAHLKHALQANGNRTGLLLLDFKKISEAFTSARIPHAFLKGFTLVPEFCPEPHLRHQSDIDILVSPDALEAARAAILASGYSLERKLRGGETRFSSPLTRIPSAADDIYAADYQRELELHTSIWEDAEQVSLRVPDDCLAPARVRSRQIAGIAFISLSQEDAFLAHVLHAFRHFLSSWVRLSWLWEIHFLLTREPEDSPLWLAVRSRAGDDPLLRNAFGLILRLTNLLFASPIPQVLRHWCVDSLPDRIHCWMREFGTRCALAGMPGSKLTLLIHKDFVREPQSWNTYLRTRLLPFAGRPRLGDNESHNAKALVAFTLKHRLFQATRAAFHARCLAAFPIQAWRWRRALAQPNAAARSLVAARATDGPWQDRS